MSQPDAAGHKEGLAEASTDFRAYHEAQGIEPPPHAVALALEAHDRIDLIVDRLTPWLLRAALLGAAGGIVAGWLLGQLGPHLIGPA